MTDTAPTRIPLATYDTGWEDAIEVARQFGKRHDPEPVQPLILVTFVEGEDAIKTDYWLSRGEAEALARALVQAARKPLADLFGADPDFTGGLDSVAYVREGRGGGKED